MSVFYFSASYQCYHINLDNPLALEQKVEMRWRREEGDKLLTTDTTIYPPETESGQSLPFLSGWINNPLLSSLLFFVVVFIVFCCVVSGDPPVL